MAGIDEVLERLVADGDFRAALARDPAAALAEYDLTREDVELLASQLDDGDDAERAVEQRTSKSAMLSMLTSLGLGGGSGDDAFTEVKETSWSWGEVKGDSAAPDDLAATGDETALWELKNARISSYQTGGSGGDGVPDGGAPDGLAAPDDGEVYNKADQIEVLSWSWGETNDADAAVPDDLAAPQDDGELYNKSKGNVEFSWKVEEGVKAEVEMDDLTHKVDPGSEEANPFTYKKISWGAAAGDAVPADGDELMGVPPDDGAPTGQGAVPDAGEEQGGPIMETEGEQAAPSGAPGDADEQGIIVINGKEEQLGAIPPDDGIVGGTPPDDTVVGGTPPDDTVVGATPPDDNVVGSTPGGGVGGDADEQGIIVINGKEEQLGAIPPDDGLAAPAADVSPEAQVEPDALNEALADEVLEIEDV